VKFRSPEANEKDNICLLQELQFL